MNIRLAILKECQRIIGDDSVTAEQIDFGEFRTSNQWNTGMVEWRAGWWYRPSMFSPDRMYLGRCLDSISRRERINPNGKSKSKFLLNP